MGTMESALQHCQRADMRGRLTEQHGTTVQPKRMKRSTDMPMQRWIGALGCDGVVVETPMDWSYLVAPSSPSGMA